MEDSVEVEPQHGEVEPEEEVEAGPRASLLAEVVALRDDLNRLLRAEKKRLLDLAREESIRPAPVPVHRDEPPAPREPARVEAPSRPASRPAWAAERPLPRPAEPVVLPADAKADDPRKRLDALARLLDERARTPEEGGADHVR